MTFKTISAKTEAQKDMIIGMAQRDVVFAFGPAGSGKTYVSCGIALEKFFFKESPINNIVIIRPNVEIGKGIGFYPGDKLEKSMNYVEPIIQTMISIEGSSETIHRMVREGRIKIIPVSLTRGYTFDNSFVILDEAQSCTIEQLKCVLTRHGENSKTVINGDLSQVDIPKEDVVLDKIANHLRYLDCVDIINFKVEDVVRSGTAQKIIKSLESFRP